MTTDQEQTEFKKSKQQQKREAEAAQNLGKAVVELPEAQFKKVIENLDLPEKLFEAWRQYRTIKSREARRRQLQFIGKLMRDIDIEPLQEFIEQLKRSGQVAAGQLHKFETWRERLLNEGEQAIEALQESYPHVDVKHVRRLVATAHREHEHNQPPRSARSLFRYLRDVLDTDAE